MIPNNCLNFNTSNNFYQLLIINGKYCLITQFLLPFLTSIAVFASGFYLLDHSLQQDAVLYSLICIYKDLEGNLIRNILNPRELLCIIVQI